MAKVNITIDMAVEDVEFILWHLNTHWPFMAKGEEKAERICAILHQGLKEKEEVKTNG